MSPEHISAIFAGLGVLIGAAVTAYVSVTELRKKQKTATSATKDSDTRQPSAPAEDTTRMDMSPTEIIRQNQELRDFYREQAKDLTRQMGELSDRINKQDVKIATLQSEVTRLTSDLTIYKLKNGYHVKYSVEFHAWVAIRIPSDVLETAPQPDPSIRPDLNM